MKKKCKACENRRKQQELNQSRIKGRLRQKRGKNDKTKK
jgi:hypothetical protein